MVAALVVGVGSWSVLARARAGGEPAPLTREAGPQPAAQPVVAPAELAATTSALPARTAGEAATGVVRGVVRDETGVVVPGWCVHLQADAPGAARGDIVGPSASRTRTAADGTFAFEGLAPGRWRLYAAATLGVSGIALSVGEHRDVDLRVMGSGTVVSFHLTSHGVPAEGWRVAANTVGDVDGYARSDAAGEALMLIEPGVHRIEILDFVGGVEPRREWKCIRTITVPANVRTFRCAFDVPTTVVAMELVGTPPPEALVFDVEGSFDDDPEPFHAALRASEGRAVMRLPAGRFRIGVRGHGLVEAARQEVLTGAVPKTSVAIVAVPARDVVLDLRRADGRRFFLPQHSPTMLALLPELVVGERGFTAAPMGENDGFLAGTARLAYPNVPLGTGTLRADDRVDHGALVFLPFDPIVARGVAVTTGENCVVLTVEPRAFVELLACSRSGMQDVRARVRVFAGQQPVQPICTPEQSRWQAFLPPGEYRVVVQRGAETTETVLTVQRDAIVMRLRP